MGLRITIDYIIIKIIKSTKVNNDTLNQYCQIFRMTHPFFKTKLKVTCKTLCTKQQQQQQQQQKRLSTSTTLQSDETMCNYILGIDGSSVQNHIYSIRIWSENWLSHD
jgi:hypothetical protein